MFLRKGFKILDYLIFNTCNLKNVLLKDGVDSLFYNFESPSPKDAWCVFWSFGAVGLDTQCEKFKDGRTDGWTNRETDRCQKKSDQNSSLF